MKTNFRQQENNNTWHTANEAVVGDIGM